MPGNRARVCPLRRTPRSSRRRRPARLVPCRSPRMRGATPPFLRRPRRWRRPSAPRRRCPGRRRHTPAERRAGSDSVSVASRVRTSKARSSICRETICFSEENTKTAAAPKRTIATAPRVSFAARDRIGHPARVDNDARVSYSLVTFVHACRRNSQLRPFIRASARPILVKAS